jgi:hypothetical protein
MGGSQAASQVEMAGIEPASEKIRPRTSTGIAGYYVFAKRLPSRQGKPFSYPFRPESPLSHASRHRMRHSGIVTPASYPAGARIRRTRFLRNRALYGGLGRHRKSAESAVGT